MTRTRRCAAALSAPALFTVVMVAAPAPTGAQTSSCTVAADDQAIDAEEQDLLGLINQYRQANGKSPLALHAEVTRAAAWFSRDMATKDYFPYDHVDSNGRSLGERLTWCGVEYMTAGENIYAGSPDAQRVFDAWRGSSGHNANMLRDGVTSAGIARAYDGGSSYRWYWTLDLTDSAPGTTTTTRPVTTTTTTTGPPTTSPPMPTTTTVPATGPAPGALPEWYWQYFGTTTTTTRPVTTTTTTIAPPPSPTTTVPTTGPAPGSQEWYRQWYSQYFGR